MGEAQVFCVECGSALDGAKFCPQCGTLTENASRMAAASAVNGETQASVATAVLSPPAATILPRVAAPQRDVPPPASPVERRPRRTALAVGAVAGLLVVAAAVVLILSSGGSGPSYADRARTALAPVVRANEQLTGALSSLTPGSSANGAQTGVHDALSAVQVAQQQLSRLKAGSGDQQFADAAQTALSSELSFLNAAATVLRSPSSPSAASLSTLADETSSNLLALDVDVPGAAASFPGALAISTWAQQQTRAAATNASLRAFTSQVGSLISQSESSFQAINQVFGQMETAAQGGAVSITLSQAQASIGNVIANRNALAATAGTLPAPTALAGQVRAALVASFENSLADDRDIQNCLNQADTGAVAYVFQSCLTSTVSDATTATQAKQHFLSLYNQLRATIGEPSTQPSF